MTKLALEKKQKLRMHVQNPSGVQQKKNVKYIPKHEMLESTAFSKERNRHKIQ